MLHINLISRAAGAATLLAVLLAGVTPARAQLVRPPATIPAPSEGLTVTGHAEVKIRPDVAYATLTVTTQAPSTGPAALDNARQTAALYAALKKAGVAERDIQTQSYSVQTQYDYRPSPPVRTGYQVQNTVRVTLHDLAQAGVIVDQATQGSNVEVGGLEFDLLDRTKVQRQALAQAVADARAKADVMAAAAGVGLGRLINLTEGQAATVQPLVFAARAALAKSDQTSTPVSPSDISVTADVTALYSVGAPSP